MPTARGTVTGNGLAKSGLARPGFTLIEFLVAIGMLGILIAILLPYAIKARESARRVNCETHIRQISLALHNYAETNGSRRPLPQTIYDAVNKPNGYVAFTGPDDPNPFAPQSSVHANDITASLWLLVRGKYVENPSVFICPSSTDIADSITSADGKAASPQQRSNFRGPENLSYSYASPFNNAYDFSFTSDLPSEFAILADKNPGYDCDVMRVIGPRRDAPPFELARGNSRNHQQAGQFVLYPAGNVSFESTPYCGVSGDNIYTALATKRLEGLHPELDAPGYLSRDIGASYHYDSYLVPTARDTFSAADGAVAAHEAPVLRDGAATRLGNGEH